ncbi:Zinc finger, PMZ-type [Corchorus capsularis]|uniref:Zinc finger, PMZ-type n=1 Tax=Corchorus capsularis TaxID=210143 RepID=A0A1R3H5C7_COCAP|nr:Zinc finger, PMZ-type [Corchorus capsularis]
MENRKAFCYCHIDGEIVLDSNRLQSYDGGRTVGVMLDENMTLSEFVKQFEQKAGTEIGNKRLMYVLPFDNSQLLDLINDDSLKDMISFGDQCVHVYAVSIATGQPSIPLNSSTNARNTKAFISVDCSISGCEWHLTAYRVGGTNFMRVGTFNNQYFHSAQDLVSIDPCHRGKLTSHLVADKLRLLPNTTPNQIRSAIETEHGILLNYKQSWRCREQSLVDINGRPEDSYRLIPWICKRLMETDQRTIAKWTSSGGMRFAQLFIAYGSSIVGFVHGCQPILFIDGCHLSGPYRGTLLSACAIDADNQIFPLAYAVVSSECYKDCYWFLKNVKEIIGSVKVTIVSDRNHNIRASVAEHYGHEYHAYCYRHIKENFGDEVRKLFPRVKQAKENALKLMDAIAYARIEKDYDVALENLRLFKQELASWVLANEPEHWVMSKFCHPRWNHITSNIAESFNSWIRIERHHSIFALINEHRDKLATKLFDAKATISSWKGEVGPNIEDKLQENIARGEFLHVVPYGYHLARVNTGKVDLAVDLATMSCICGEWAMTGIPCPHAAAVIRMKKLNIYDFVQHWYKKSNQELIYHNSIKPVEMHDVPTLESMDRSFIDSDETFLLPPITKVPVGRPQKKRIESQFNKKRDYTCTRCHVVGHSRRSCKNPNPS